MAKTKAKNLCEYLEQIPIGTGRQAFYKQVARVCGVSYNCAVNYCKGFSKPKDPAKVEAIAQLTGISSNRLFL